MKKSTKVKVIIAIAMVLMASLSAGLIYLTVADVLNPSPTIQHGSYAHCEYRVAKGACGKWTTKTY